MPTLHEATPRRSEALPSAELGPGSVVEGKWQFGEKLGRGGMGTVYVARDLELGREVAIKVLAPALCDDAELVQRFEREARMMARLEHPNLVPVYSVGRAGRVPFIVMKRLVGSTLAELLLARGRFPLGDALDVTRRVCAGLQYLHENGVVHRDIKPGNIFIGPDGHVTLLDLGVARDASTHVTRSGVTLGTPRYMAPEQIQGGAVDARADLYALTAVLFELITGRPVFSGATDYEVMQAHVSEAPPDLLGTGAVPPELAVAVLKGLAKNPADRFHSALAMAETLGRVPGVASTEGLVALREPLAPTARSAPVRARRLGLPLAGAVALGVAAAAAWWGTRQSAAPPPPPAVTRAPPPAAPREPEPPPAPAPLPAPAPAPAVEAHAKAPPPPKRGPAEIRCLTATPEGDATWAYLDLDGLRQGTTPLDLKLEPGEHTLVFRRPGYAPQTRTLSAAPGERQTLKVVLAAQ